LGTPPFFLAIVFEVEGRNSDPAIALDALHAVQAIIYGRAACSCSGRKNILNVAMRNPALFKGGSSEFFYLFFICYWVYTLKSVQVAATLAVRTTTHRVNT